MLTSVLAEIESRGVEMDTKKVRHARPRINRALDALYRQMEALYGHPFNPWSGDDVRGFLNDKCGLRLGKTQPIHDDLLKGLGRSYPCPEAPSMAATISHEAVPGPLSGPRSLLSPMVAHSDLGRSDRLYRSSSAKPSQYLRRYLSPGKGRMFIKADFSAFQLRLLAHLSQDPVLVDLFRTGRNPHDETQARLNARGLPITRAQAKTVNFSICYGGTAWSLKDNLGLGIKGIKEAQHILREMKEIYPGHFRYLAGVKEDLDSSPESERYVRSIRGRRRSFSHPGDLTARERRQAANAVVQMLEADVFKKTVLELDRAFKRDGLPVEIILLLHDGIWFSCPQEIREEVTVLIRQVMETAVELSVPLEVDFS